MATDGVVVVFAADAVVADTGVVVAFTAVVVVVATLGLVAVVVAAELGFVAVAVVAAGAALASFSRTKESVHNILPQNIMAYKIV